METDSGHPLPALRPEIALILESLPLDDAALLRSQPWAKILAGINPAQRSDCSEIGFFADWIANRDLTNGEGRETAWRRKLGLRFNTPVPTAESTLRALTGAYARMNVFGNFLLAIISSGQFQSLVRTALKGAGVWLVAHTNLDSASVDTWIGGAMAAWGTLLSVVAHSGAPATGIGAAAGPGPAAPAPAAGVAA